MTDQPETQPMIDLERHLWKRTKGDITVYGTWSLHSGRPVMVLVPTFVPRHSVERAVPCLIPLDAAFLWDEHTGDPSHCAQMTFQFAQVLPISPFNPSDMIRLTSIIREHLGDLLTMAPLPESEREVVADAILTDPNTGKTKETEIVDYVH